MLGTLPRENLGRVGSSGLMLAHSGSLESSADYEQLLAESGARFTNRGFSPERMVEIARTADFLTDVRRGRRYPQALMERINDPRFQRNVGDLFAISTAALYQTYPVNRSLTGMQMRETLTTSDLPLLTGTDVINRELEGGYQAAPITWPNIARRGVNNDFRDTRVVRLFGLDDRWYPQADYQQPEMTAVREKNNLEEEGYLVGVDVWARSFSVNWRMFVNDDLNSLQNLPQRLAVGERRTEEFFVTSLYATSTGPDSTFFSSGNGNLVTGNPALSAAALGTAMQMLMSQVDENNEPIMAGQMAELMIPPHLYVAARQIMEATTIRLGSTTGTTGGELEVANWLRGMFRINVNPYLPVIDTTHGTTAWYLFANPNVGRPAIDFRYLRGWETPQLFQKAPNTIPLGSGAADPLLGDFDTLELRYKGMAIFGAVTVDPKSAVASEGDGT